MGKSKSNLTKPSSVFVKANKPDSTTGKDDKKGTPIAPWVLVEKFLTERYNFRINSVLNKVEFKPVVGKDYTILTDYDYNSLNRQIVTSGLSCSVHMLRSLLFSNYTVKYNPFVDFFTKLPVWDGCTDYIDNLASTVKTTDEQFWHMCFKRWFVALLACSIDTKVVNHTVIVFSGNQGIGKTTWLRKLIPESLEQYVYSGSINPNNKDTLVHLSECILINLDELESLNKSELGSIKELITKDTIRVRKAYGHDTETFVRRASFAGSVNKKEFLSDTTGNRRFLCFEVEKIDYTKKLDLINAFSQAYALYKSGFKFWFSPDEIITINKNNEQFRSASIEEEWLLENFEPCEVADAQENKSTTELVKLLGETNKVVNPDASARKLGMALKAQGFKSFKKNQRKVYALKRNPYQIFGDLTLNVDSDKTLPNG